MPGTTGPARAQRHANDALHLWRRHKARAVLYAVLALGELAAWAVRRGAHSACQAARKLRQATGA